MDRLKNILVEALNKAKWGLTRPAGKELIDEITSQGESVEDALFLLLHIARGRANDSYPNRASGDGTGSVGSLVLTEHPAGNTITIMNEQGEDVMLNKEAGAYRFRTNYGWITRDRAEESLAVWPGYLDAVQDMIYILDDVEFDTSSLSQKIQREIDRKIDRVLSDAERETSIGGSRAIERWGRKHKDRKTDRIPDKLKQIKGILQLDYVQPCHVYFLMLEGEVQYIGKTGSLWPGRIEDHIADPEKIFDDVCYIEVTRDRLHDTERYYIRCFNPPLNKVYANNGVTQK